MMIIVYTQRDGFASAAFEPDQRDGEETREWLARAGFHKGADDGEAYEPLQHFDVHLRTEQAQHEWEAAVIIDNGNRYHVVFVPTEADLLGLHVALAPFVLMGVIESIDELHTLAQRAFRAWHGHAPHGMCDECDPEGMKHWRDAQKKKRAQ